MLTLRIPAIAFNCGTGADGFESGNTCGAGGGGGGGLPENTGTHGEDNLTDAYTLKQDMLNEAMSNDEDTDAMHRDADRERTKMLKAAGFTTKAQQDAARSALLDYNDGKTKDKSVRDVLARVKSGKSGSSKPKGSHADILKAQSEYSKARMGPQTAESDKQWAKTRENLKKVDPDHPFLKRDRRQRNESGLLAHDRSGEPPLVGESKSSIKNIGRGVKAKGDKGNASLPPGTSDRAIKAAKNRNADVMETLREVARDKGTPRSPSYRRKHGLGIEVHIPTVVLGRAN